MSDVLKSVLLGGLAFMVMFGIWMFGAEILRPVFGAVGDMWFPILLLFLLVFWMFGGMIRTIVSEQENEHINE